MIPPADPRGDDPLGWLNSSLQFGIKLGLENIRALLHELGSPQEELRFIHVAGTNGKGSVCAMIEAILRVSGLRTGLYTSPHLMDLRERIRVDGRMIHPLDLEAGLRRVRAASENGVAPTYFEIMTALAMDHFRRAGCDVVVLETGMGGRFDATNVVRPLVSVITEISMDHAKWLGDTVEKIAAEKAGIIKPQVPALVLKQEARVENVFRAAAAAVAAPIRFIDAGINSSPLAGQHQLRNGGLAVEALRAAGLHPGDALVNKGLRSVCWPGRFQELGRFILDGAHNESATRHLAETWRSLKGAEKVPVIFGVLGDKDAAGMLSSLARIASRLLCVPVQSDRSAEPEGIASLAHTMGLDAVVCTGIGDALSRAASGSVLVTGSLFLVGEFLNLRGVPPFETADPLAACAQSAE